jgi:hypothetical protein
MESAGEQFLKLCQMSLIEILPQHSLDNGLQFLECDLLFAIEEHGAVCVGGLKHFQEDAVFVEEL